MKFLPLIIANLLRRWTATMLTGLSMAATIFIFSTLIALDRGVDRMIDATGQAETITVFERYKACPPYSSLPVSYAAEIAEIEGVADVMAVRFLLSNCQTTTDLVAVHGVEPARLRDFESIDVPDAHYAAFAGERSAALVGTRIAEKYGWKLGDQVVLEALRGIPFVI
ncbi:MAG: ABC transporter permease, partial [Bradymonadaceae bacterium]